MTIGKRKRFTQCLFKCTFISESWIYFPLNDTKTKWSCYSTCCQGEASVAMIPQELCSLCCLLCDNDTPWEAGCKTLKSPEAPPGWEQGNYSGSTPRLTEASATTPLRLLTQVWGGDGGLQGPEKLFFKHVLVLPLIWFVFFIQKFWGIWNQGQLTAEEIRGIKQCIVLYEIKGYRLDQRIRGQAMCNIKTKCYLTQSHTVPYT